VHLENVTDIFHDILMKVDFSQDSSNMHFSLGLGLSLIGKNVGILLKKLQ